METSGGVGDELWVDRLSVWRRRSRRRSTDMVAERTEKVGSIGFSRRKAETSSPGPMGEEGGGVENVQRYMGRRDLGDSIWINRAGRGIIESGGGGMS